MKDRKLTVITICFNSADFVSAQADSLYKLSDDKFDYIVFDNGSNINELSKLLKLKEKYNDLKIVISPKVYNQGSLAHGYGLDEAVKFVQTDFFMILDSDCSLLLKSWDKLLLNKFDESTSVLGVKTTNREEIPQNRLMIVRKSLFDKLKITNMPSFKSGERIIPLNDTSSDIIRLKKISDFKLLEYKNTRFSKKMSFSNLKGVEEYYIDNKLLASHFGRGSSLGAAKYSKILPKFLRKIIGYYDKRKWLNIVDDLITKQLYN